MNFTSKTSKSIAMKTLQTLQNNVKEEYDSRNLKCNARYNALDKIIDFIKTKYKGDSSILQCPKKEFKSLYESYKGKELNSAESSAINELYNQYNK